MASSLSTHASEKRIGSFSHVENSQGEALARSIGQGISSHIAGSRSPVSFAAPRLLDYQIKRHVLAGNRRSPSVEVKRLYFKFARAAIDVIDRRVAPEGEQRIAR